MVNPVGHGKALAIVLLLFLASSSLASSRRDVDIEVVERGESPSREDGVLEIWCELRNSGGPGTALIEAWVVFQIGVEHEEFRKSEYLSEDSGETLFFSFDVPAHSDGHSFGFLVRSEANLDGSTPSRGFGGWEEGLLSVVGVLALVCAIYAGLRLYVRWVHKVTDVAKAKGPGTRFEPVDVDEGGKHA